MATPVNTLQRGPTPTTADALAAIRRSNNTSGIHTTVGPRPQQANFGKASAQPAPATNPFSAMVSFGTAVPVSKTSHFAQGHLQQRDGITSMTDLKRTIQREAAAAMTLKRETPGLRCEAKVAAVIHDKALKPTWRTDAEVPTTDVAKHRCKLVAVERSAFDYIPSGNDEYKILKKLEPMPKPLLKIKEMAEEERQLIGVSAAEVENIRLQIHIKRGEVGEIEAIKGTQTVLAEVARVLQEAKDRSAALTATSLAAHQDSSVARVNATSKDQIQSQRIATDVRHELLLRFVKSHPIDCVGVATKAMQDVRSTRVDRIRARKGQKRHVHVLFKDVFKDLSASAFPTSSLREATMDLVKGRTGHTGDLLNGERDGRDNSIADILQPLKSRFWEDPPEWMIQTGVLMDLQAHYSGTTSNATTSRTHNHHTFMNIGHQQHSGQHYGVGGMDLSQNIAASVDVSQILTRATTPAALLFDDTVRSSMVLNATRVGDPNPEEATPPTTGVSNPLSLRPLQQYSQTYTSLHSQARSDQGVRLDSCGQARFTAIVQRITTAQQSNSGGAIDFTAEKPIRYIQLTTPQPQATRVSIAARGASVVGKLEQRKSVNESATSSSGALLDEVPKDPTAEELSLIAAMLSAANQSSSEAVNDAPTAPSGSDPSMNLGGAVMRSQSTTSNQTAGNSNNGIKSATELIATVGHWHTLYQFMYADALAKAKSDEDEEIKSNPLPDDFEPTCVICWSQYDQCRGGGGALDEGDSVQIEGATVRLHSLHSTKAVTAKQRHDAETAELLKSADKAASGLTHWKAMHQHVNVRQRKALERAIECRDVSSELVNQNPHQLARLLQGANMTSVHWRLARSLSPLPMASVAGKGTLNQISDESLIVGGGAHTPPRSPVPNGGPQKRLSTDEFGLDPKYATLDWSDMKKAIASGNTANKAARAGRNSSDSLMAIGANRIAEPLTPLSHTHIGPRQSATGTGLSPLPLSPPQKRSPSPDTDEGDRNKELVELVYERASDNMSTTSIAKRRVGLNSLWDKPRKDMTLQAMRWCEVEKLWVRLTQLMHAYQFPEGRMEERLMQDLLSTLLEAKCVRHSTLFVWLRVAVQNARQRSHSASNNRSSRLTANSSPTALIENINKVPSGERLLGASVSLANYLLEDKDGGTDVAEATSPLPAMEKSTTIMAVDGVFELNGAPQSPLPKRNQSLAFTSTSTSKVGAPAHTELIHFLTSTRRGYRFLVCMCNLFEVPLKVLEVWCKAPSQRRVGWKVPMDEGTAH